ncbi:hypothetical protein B4144_4071 [Bacillus atrophaeus]|nr:hypothetical protein B4144_4071 [Bacillus atrophaeus]
MKIEAVPLSVKGETFSHSGTVFLFLTSESAQKPEKSDTSGLRGCGPVRKTVSTPVNRE